MKKVSMILVAALVAMLLCGCELGKGKESPIQHPEGSENLPNPVNLIQSFSVEEQQVINRFVRDVITYGDIQNYPNVDNGDLIRFVADWCFDKGKTEYVYGMYDERMPAAIVDEVLWQYFGRTITHQSIKNEEGHLYEYQFEYQGGYYYWPAAAGYNPPAPLTFVEELYKEQNGTYRAIYSIYWIDMALSDPADFSYLSPGEEYWDYVPEKYDSVILSQASSFPELEKQGTGTIILKDYVENDGTKAYQLVSLP